MRVGIIALLQESNTFLPGRTSLQHFQQDLLATGEAVRQQLAGTEHEVGGFFQGLESHGMEAVPLFAARAYPYGRIEPGLLDLLTDQMLQQIDQTGPLDGILVAPHGATVAADHPDADGHWLTRLRSHVGADLPIIATLDPHANLSPAMLAATHATIAYATNPHLDQRATGLKAAHLMARTLEGSVRPTQAAAFPPLAINIQSQNTAEPPLAPLYEGFAGLARQPGVLSHSLLLGFPYADVPEMGSATLVVTDNDPALAQQLAEKMATLLWQQRQQFEPVFTSPQQAVQQALQNPGRSLLLDMGDNIGGGSSADATHLLHLLMAAAAPSAFVCLYDPDSVRQCQSLSPGASIHLQLGSQCTAANGGPCPATCTLLGLHEGRFEESQARHSGIRHFDQGPTAVLRSQAGPTIMLTSRRMPPFSLQQLISCGLDPCQFDILVAKGVIAPLAAYQPVVDHVIHVNTPGVTCADMTQLTYQHRRCPMFPFENDTLFPIKT